MKLYYLVLFLLFPFVCFCQKVEIKISKDEIASNEQVELEFTFNEFSDSIRQPNYSDFFIIRGPNRTSSSKTSNGTIKSLETISYVLKPKQSGKFCTIVSCFLL